MSAAPTLRQCEVLFLTRSLDYGGSERQLVALAGGLSKRGLSIAVATFYSGGVLRYELETNAVPVVSLGKRSRWDVLAFLWRLADLVRKKHPVFMHSYLGSANILAVLLKPLFGDMKVIWGVRSSNMDLAQYGRLDRALYWIECKLSRFADLIVVNSFAGLEYAVRHGFPRSKMVVIQNGIDAKEYHPDHEGRKRVRREWTVGDDEVLIGLVGRLDPMKGHETFLQAASTLRRTTQHVRFVCVGGGSEDRKNRLRALGASLNLEENLIWAGERQDMRAVYNALDIATSSSYGEGFSNVIGEAMACGIPCVVTDVGDARRIVGEFGTVVRPKSSESLMSAWQHMLDIGPTARDEVGRRGEARIKELFGMEKLIGETMGILEGIKRC